LDESDIGQDVTNLWGIVGDWGMAKMEWTCSIFIARQQRKRPCEKLV